jgi:hypothetical protein
MAHAASTTPRIWLLAPIYSWRAARGARRMDRKASGWHGRIDKKKLTFDNPYDCIIGQGVGDFRTHVEEIIGTRSGVLYTLRVIGKGFAPGYLASIGSMIRDLLFDEEQEVPSSNRLKMAWIYQIDKRLAAMPAAD